MQNNIPSLSICIKPSESPKILYITLISTVAFWLWYFFWREFLNEDYICFKDNLPSVLYWTQVCTTVLCLSRRQWMHKINSFSITAYRSYLGWGILPFICKGWKYFCSAALSNSLKCGNTSTSLSPLWLPCSEQLSPGAHIYRMAIKPM